MHGKMQAVMVIFHKYFGIFCDCGGRFGAGKCDIFWESMTESFPGFQDGRKDREERTSLKPTNKYNCIWPILNKFKVV